MPQFIATKIVTATAMTRGAYYTYVGLELPVDENAADPGYLVEYQGVSEPNPQTTLDTLSGARRISLKRTTVRTPP